MKSHIYNNYNIQSYKNFANDWLFKISNLTKELKKIYPNLGLKKISQDVDELNIFEKNLLSQDNALVREIVQLSDDRLIVYARTIIPKDTYDFFKQTIDSLGDKAIGDNFLFKDNMFVRDSYDNLAGSFLVRKISLDNFNNEAGDKLKNNFDLPNKEIFSRTAIFSYKNNTNLKILITEYFLNLEELGSVDKR